MMSRSLRPDEQFSSGMLHTVSSYEVLRASAPAADARISYGDAPSQYGDLRVPTTPGPHPVAIVVHGGYWRAAYTLDYMGQLSEALRRSGVATWNVEYARVGEPGGGWPRTFLDVAESADALRTLAAAYHLDLTRVLALGHSAGGHLALWLAARRRLPAGDPLFQPDPLPIRAAIALAGVVDLHEAWRLQLSNGAVGALMRGTPKEMPARYRSGSPAALSPLGVPQILIHGTADDSAPFALSETYLAAGLACGDDVRLIALPDANHFAVVDPQTAEGATVIQTVLSLL